MRGREPLNAEREKGQQDSVDEQTEHDDKGDAFGKEAQGVISAEEEDDEEFHEADSHRESQCLPEAQGMKTVDEHDVMDSKDQQASAAKFVTSLSRPNMIPGLEKAEGKGSHEQHDPEEAKREAIGPLREAFDAVHTGNAPSFEAVELPASPPQSPIPAVHSVLRAQPEHDLPSLDVPSTLESTKLDDLTESSSTYSLLLEQPQRPQTPTIIDGDSGRSTPPVPVSPLTAHEASYHSPSNRDSMASIALSDTSLDYDHLSADQVEDVLATPRVHGSRHHRKVSSLDILHNLWAGEDVQRRPMERQSTLFDMSKDQPLTPVEQSPWDEEGFGSMLDYELGLPTRAVNPGGLAVPKHQRFHARSSSLNAATMATVPFDEAPLEVDWQALDESEWQEKEDKDLPEGVEDESTAFLLARLEQENAKISAFTASAQANHAESHNRMRSESKPPTMDHLKRLVEDRNAGSIRYSLALPDDLPEPPPMTELEFWAALVQDYPSTASRLPTLTTVKIRGGIPPPLRGVVWQSMAGARDRSLEDAFERLQNEQSPYEGIINKDVGRSFPGVELFQDAEGEGQKMLGRVLKCFSLHDKDIGYCQGLGFLVGPLLMNMGERDAFCVLVRLMEHYDLRPSFLPSLSGLHMRIYQFSSLLRQHQPRLADHLASLGIEPAYLSQWFLSCFAVTCPLPMLFRIYDVIFAEGANETVMRVALALMRRNEEQMMASHEFEDVMQLLLGRGIWDCYGLNADELVDDFTSLGSIITHARLAELEKEFEKQSSEAVGAFAGFLPDVQAAAARFLGRLWAPAHAANKSTSTLSPPSADSEPGSRGIKIRTGSFLRRKPSQQSIITLNDAHGSDGSSTNSSASASLASTVVTEPDLSTDTVRDSTAETMSLKSAKAGSFRTVSISTTGHGTPTTSGLSKGERDMHGQIEDLLTALSEMQREHAQLAAMLQREREERGEDHRAVKQLLRRLRSGESESTSLDVEEDRSLPAAEVKDRRKTLPPLPRVAEEFAGSKDLKPPRPLSGMLQSSHTPTPQSLIDLINAVDQRMQSHARLSLSFETKAQLRSTLVRTREQLAEAESRSKDLAIRVEAAELSAATANTEADDLRAEVRELRVRVNEEFKSRQKLEHTIRELKQEARILERKERERLVRADSMQEVPSRRSSIATFDELSGARARVGSLSSKPGLRELKLGRRDSTSSIHSIRTTRLQRVAAPEIRVQTQQLSSGTSSANGKTFVDATDSPAEPASAYTEATPISASGPSPALTVPGPGMWHARTSSLATQEVFATPEHEAVPEEALLLELVNSKTAEAQARAEVDEIKRTLAQANKRHESMLQILQAQIDAANKSAEAARSEAEAAKAAANHARQELLAREREGSIRSFPTTPAAYDSDNKSIGGTSEMATPFESPLPPLPVEKAKGAVVSSTPVTAGAGVGGGWFWSRRTPSTPVATISVTPPAE